MEQRTVELIKTLSIQTTSYKTKKMNKYIMKEVSKIPNTKVFKDNGNIYITKGEADTYPCIVAHTDTVHDMYKNFHIFKLDDILFSINGDTLERVGIGGDDKVGIHIALEVLRTVNVCKVAFFRDEEVGCVGSQAAKMDFFDDAEFVLQCDRQGYDDFVNNIFGCQLYGDDFSSGIADTLHKYGKKETSGGLTDVYQLVQNGLNVAVANMSCGYYDPHSDNEYVSITDINNTLDMVLEIFEQMSGTVWTTEDKDRYLTGHSLRSYQWSYNDDDRFDEFDRFENEVEGVDCPCCMNQTDYDMYVYDYWCYECDAYVEEIKEKIIDEETSKRISYTIDDINKL
jgi:di/tripeptidase